MSPPRTSLGFLLGAASLGASAHAATIVQDGQPRATIVVETQGSTPEKFAAQELQRYVKSISGATLPIREKAGSGTDLIVAVSPAGTANSPFKTGDNSEAFALETRGEDLYLLGNSPRGALYAAYTWLEKQGVHFWAPDFDFYQGHAEQVPQRKTLALENLKIIEQPSLAYRRKYVEEGWSHTPKTLPKLLDWMAKNRANVLVYPYNYQNAGHTRYDSWRDQLLPEIQKRDLILEVGGHGYQSFLPPEQYKAAHSDWFIEGYNVFNTANEAALQTYIDNVIAYLKERPEIKIFDAWPPDSAKWPSVIVEKYGGIPNAEAYVTNRLSAAVSKALPGVSVETLAYTPSIEPPDPGSMYSDKTFINFAWYGRSYRDAINKSDFPLNVTYNNLIEKWQANGFKGNIGVYEYYRKYAWHSLPVVLPRLYAEEIPYYRQLGANGLGTYSEPGDWITYELTHAEIAALSWNTELKADQWLNDYLNNRFGKAAPALAEYYTAVEAAGRSLFHEANGGDYGKKDAVAGARDNYKRAGAALERAQALAEPNSTAAFLIERLGWNLEFAQTDVKISYHVLRGEKPLADAQRAKLESLLTKYRLDGVVLQHPFVIRRFRPDAARPENREPVREQLAPFYQDAWR